MNDGGSDTVYRVLTVYDADTSKGKSEIGGFAIVLDHMVNLAREGVHIVSELTEKILDLGSKAETTRIAIAGLFTASGFKGAQDFTTSMAMSSEIMKKMIVDAAKLPGTVEDLQEIFQGGVVGGQKAGKSIIDIEDLSGKMMAVGKAFQLPTQMIRQEFSEMMEGRVRNMTPLFSKLKQFMGEDMNAGAFNALSAPEKWERIEKALAKFNPMIEAYGHTWDAVSSTTQSYADQLLRIGSSGVFDFMKAKLEELNGWYEKNKDQVDAIAKKLSEDLAQKLKVTFDAIKDVITFIIAHREAITTIAEAFAVFKGFQYLSAGGGFGSGGGAAGAPGLANVLGGGMFGAALSHFAGETNIVTTAMMTLEGAMSQLPGIVGMVAKGLLGLHAGLEWLADQLDKGQKKDIEERGDLGDPMSVLGTYDPRRSSIQKDMGERMAGFLRAHNIIKNDALDPEALRSYLINAEATGALDIGAVRDFQSFAERTAAQGFLRRHLQPLDGAEFGPGLGDAKLTPDQRIQQLLAEAGKPVHVQNTNIGAVNLYTTIYDSEDSGRVVQHLANKIRAGIEHPAQSPSVAVYR